MSQADLELTLSMLCRKCGRKLVLMSEKLEAQMNGGLCQDCVGVGGSELKVIDEAPQRKVAPSRPPEPELRAFPSDIQSSEVALQGSID
jgi:hypothetical protein